MGRLIGRSRRFRAARGLVAVTGLALVAGGWPTNAVYADEARDAIASKWSRFRAVAVAQGIAYQYTYTGDALASGANERWGGVISGSLGYSFAETNDSRAAGIGSIFWPGFVTAQYKEAVPILADTVPIVGISTPDNIREVVKTGAGAAPAYPFIAATTGAKAGEYAAMPPTEVPGGSLSGATMRCNPEAASVHCSGRVANASLGPPADKAQASAVMAKGIDTTADAVLTEHEVRSTSTVDVASLDILGSVHLGSIRAVATNVANGATSEVKRTVAIGEATVAGQAVTIDDHGVSLAGNPAMKQADYDKANTQLRDSLAANGITIRLFGGSQTKAAGGGGTSDEGEALYIGLKLAEYGVPDSFSYWNYWVGGTLNSASGVLDATPTASDADETTESARAMPSASPDGGASTPTPMGLRSSLAVAPARQQLGSTSFVPPAEPAPRAAPEPTSSALPLQAVRAAATHEGGGSTNKGVLVLLGLWQVLALVVIAAVGRARLVARA